MKRWIPAAVGVGVLASLLSLTAQTGGTPFRIEKLDPSLDDVISPDA